MYRRHWKPPLAARSAERSSLSFQSFARVSEWLREFFVLSLVQESATSVCIVTTIRSSLSTTTSRSRATSASGTSSFWTRCLLQEEAQPRQWARSNVQERHEFAFSALSLPLKGYDV